MHRGKWSRAAALCAAIMGIGGAARLAVAGPITSGDILLYRVGDGGTTLSSAAAPVFIDEYTPTGTYVQTINMPTADNGSNHALTSSGSAVEGLMNLSADGRYLMLTGYGAVPGTAAIASTTSASVPRVVGRIDAAGNVDTSTALNNVNSGNNVRSATSTDGQNIWVAGAGNGIGYTTLGSTSATNVISFKSRNVTIYGGQLYFGSDSASATTGVSQTATPLPTSASSAVALTGVAAANGNSANQFAFAHLGSTGSDPDTLYVADDTGNALTKYSLESGTWVAKGKVGAGADDYTGLTLEQNGNVVTIFATLQRGGSADELVSITDSSGYDGSIAGATVNVLVTASDSTHYAFEGLAVAPTPEPGTISLIGVGLAAGLLRRRHQHPSI